MKLVLAFLIFASFPQDPPPLTIVLHRMKSEGAGDQVTLLPGEVAAFQERLAGSAFWTVLAKAKEVDNVPAAGRKFILDLKDGKNDRLIVLMPASKAVGDEPLILERSKQVHPTAKEFARIVEILDAAFEPVKNYVGAPRVVKGKLTRPVTFVYRGGLPGWDGSIGEGGQVNSARIFLTLDGKTPVAIKAPIRKVDALHDAAFAYTADLASLADLSKAGAYSLSWGCGSNLSIPESLKLPDVVAQVGSRIITLEHLRLSKAVERVRVAARDLMPDYGFLIRLMEGAAEEEIAARFGAKITDDELAKERLRIDRETKEPENLQKIKDVLVPYPGMYEHLVIRCGYLANNKVHSLFKYDRKIQAAAYTAGEAALKKALADPATFEKAGALIRIDSRKAESNERPEAFAEEHLSKIKPGEICPTLIDEDYACKIVRLVERDNERVVYETVSFAKRRFEEWYSKELESLEMAVFDDDLRKELETKAKGHPLMNQLFK